MLRPLASALFLSILASACSSGSEENARDAGVDAAPPSVGTVETFVEVDGASEGIAFGPGPVLWVGISGALHRIDEHRNVEHVVDVPGLLGIAVRADGDLLACGKGEGELGKSKTPGVIWHVKPDGTKDVLIGPSGDFAFQQPNFLAIAKDGSLVFSDSAADKVYRAAADGTGVALVTDAITYPNGLAFSPDGATLFVASWNGKKVHALARRADGSFDAPTVAVGDVENVDGVTVAENGDLFLIASGLGVLRAKPSGAASAVAPGASFALPANGAFGRGPFGERWLYVTNLIGNRISRVFVDETGAALP